jgi:hypothetical protein
MKVAYLILAHANPTMLRELIIAINRPKETIFVHIDKKTNIRPFKELLSGKCTFIEPRAAVSWGSFSMIRATVHLMKAASSAGDFDYHCLLSGSDYPIKPITSFEACLEANRPAEFIQCVDTVHSAKMCRRYQGFYLFENRSELWKKVNFGFTKIQRKFYKRKRYDNQPIFCGSQWWTLTDACVKYIIRLVETNPQWARYFKYVHVPDEHLFQTIIMRSPFAENVKTDNLRCFVFEASWKSHPKTWTFADKEILLQSPAYFARKFELSKDCSIVEFLKHHLINEQANASK